MFSGKTDITLRDLPPLIAAAVLPLIPIVMAGGLLAALPVLLLILPLLFGRFPGESVIERLAARPTRRPRHERRGLAPRPRPIAVATLLRTRLLIAASLAERPPPALLVTS
jgi:hypothetical protein